MNQKEIDLQIQITQLEYDIMQQQSVLMDCKKRKLEAQKALVQNADREKAAQERIATHQERLAELQS